MNRCPNCGEEFPSSAGCCPNCGQPLSNSPSLPMKWYKFLVNFALAVGGIMNILSGVSTILGGQYAVMGLSSELVYEFFPSMKPVDMIFGILTAALGVACLHIRQQLADFRSGSPKRYLLVAVIACNVVSMMYTLISGIIFESVDLLRLALSAIGIVLAVLLQYRYFKRREHLFVNETP